MRKILYICHNHPGVRPGGAELYALELYEAMKASSQFEPFFLARGGPPVSPTGRLHSGTQLEAINGDPNQYLFYTDFAEYDPFYCTSHNKQLSTSYFRRFLQDLRPDVVHFQHTMLFGYEFIREVRNTLPAAPIVYTIHEYQAICHRNGQMLRTLDGNELCTHASPRRCHECFPGTSPQAFFLRKKLVQSHLSLVDMFLSPSRFLLERHVSWGIPREKIRFEENGRNLNEHAHVNVVDDHKADVTAQPQPRNRLGFFGQITPFKGIDVLLNAIKMLYPGDIGARRAHQVAEDSGLGDLHLWVHGANLDMQPTPFQKLFGDLLESTRARVTMMGKYNPRDLPHLMSQLDWVVVPSVWWENAPLVIQEAFHYGKPVICSDIGGMAEKVGAGVNGLHFRAGNARSLSQTIRRAVTTPGLWESLVANIPEVYRIEKHVESLIQLYESLIARAAAN
jgi:glycosyltransferase involved in cell wall biosynthesis